MSVIDATKLHKILYNVTKPYQYIGNEYLSANKEFDKDKVSVVFAFPDKYEVGVSNLGIRVLYNAVNKHEDLLADRSYAPEPDFLAELENNGLSLYGVETKRPYKDFDFVGFSMQYELAYPTILRMLKVSDIAVLRKDRAEDDPIIMAGGPCCYNPMPMSDFIDIFIIGDGEDVNVEIMQKYKEIRHLSRREKIVELAKIKGVYSSGLNNKTEKRIAQLSNDNLPYVNPVPYSSSIHDRTIIEIRRGCGRMCRFCQPGHVTLPIRERKAEDIIAAVDKSTKLTGYDEYSLLSLSSNDYTNIEPVIDELSAMLCERKVSVSLPSQRIDRYNEHLAEMVRGIRKSTITLAPEAGSQRLRNVINKNLSEEQILTTVLNCYKTGADSIKLYFILGLPTETKEDIDEMAGLLSKIRWKSMQIKKDMGLVNPLKLTCTVSVFVPKPFTPFQRHSQNTNAEIKEKIAYLLSLTDKIKNVKINYHNPFVSRLEAAFTRGDKKFGKLIYELYKKGAYLTSWDEYLDYSLWEETAAECGISYQEEASKQYGKDDILPWEVIDMGIPRSWFEQEYEKALQAINTIPCEFNCVNCGVCSKFKTHKVSDKKYSAKLTLSDVNSHCDDKDLPVYKFRLKLTKEGDLRYLSHLDWQNTLIKVLYRSGLKLNFSKGFNPTPKISLGLALPIFVESVTEFIDIEILDNISETELKEGLSNILPPKINLLSVKQIPKSEKSVDNIVEWAEYTFKPIERGIYDINSLLYDINNKFTSDSELTIQKKSKKGILKTINIKPSVKSISMKDDAIVMVLKTGQSSDIPALRADTAIELFLPDIKFEIKRTKFFDGSMCEIDF
ncbi:MAG: TIGR03960 family B12-binding radical SAM protein [Candidatus Gastranaerophilales bacterium]|nr:TIGR03960 family B12-binding radical SAM protein [Candidatus Gastranaerophilales bacterium]